MSLPKQTSWKELVRKFRDLGWSGPIGGTKHLYMVKEKRKQHIPNPHRGDISIELLKEILWQAKISDDEWERA